MAREIVVAGGGFRGFDTARTLERVLLAQSAHVTLVSEDDFMLYTPLLPLAAPGTPAPEPVCAPSGLPRSPQPSTLAGRRPAVPTVEAEDRCR